MAFLALTSAQCDADSPLDETLFQLIRTNFDDHESRIGSNEALNDQSIRDDFSQTAIDTDTWVSSNGGAGTAPTLVVLPEHSVNLQTTGIGGYSILSATTKRMRFDLNYNHSIFFEARVKIMSASYTSDVFFGFQDDSLTPSAANNVDITDMIGFIKGTNNDTVKFRTSKGAGGASTSDNLGNIQAWERLTITIDSTGGGATITIHAYIDGVEISGSPFTNTANIPLTAGHATLIPWLGMSTTAGGTTNCHIDYALFYWRARPLST